MRAGVTTTWPFRVATPTCSTGRGSPAAFSGSVNGFLMVILAGIATNSRKRALLARGAAPAKGDRPRHQEAGAFQLHRLPEHAAAAA